MIDWTTVAYIAALGVAYLWGRSNKSYMSYKAGYEEGMKEGVNKSVDTVAEALMEMGKGELLPDLSEKVGEIFDRAKEAGR